MQKLISFCKKDIVLTAAWVLAIVSAFFVPPQVGYLEYIDFRSLGLLWSLMVIMKIFQKDGVFSAIGMKLIEKTHTMRQLVIVLVLLCFFFSMLITNDVALITFVPFAIMMLSRCGRSDMMIPVIVLQTIAANLGSMMTPIGNPQNLYLCGLSGLGFAGLGKLVFPYTFLALILLIACIFCLRGGSDRVEAESEEGSSSIRHKRVVAVYAIAFVAAMLVVVRIFPYWVLVLAIALVSLLLRQDSVFKVDYALLLTFIGFFIFTGNMQKIPAVSDLLDRLVTGNEIAAGVLTSQVISNVPSALLISSFTHNIKSLILGVNIGGLGTLIASMASLISYKLYAAEAGSDKGKYMVEFSAFNIALLAALLLECFVLRTI
ncbi:MAG: citrate transporter [Lachnospiraceae bacterium]|nr:citrate transporter [Lachnospiraceae bacterium]